MVELWKNLKTALPGIWKYRGWALCTTLLLGLIGAGVSIMLPGVYEATARAHVNTQSILKPLMQGMTVQPNVEQQVHMMARTLISRPNLEKVARAARPDWESMPEDARTFTLDSLQRNIVLLPAGGTNFYSIQYRNESKVYALKVVDSLLSIFVETTKSSQTKDTQQALAFIDEQISLAKEKLEKTENALKDFKIQHINVMPNLAQDYVARSSEAQLEQQRAKLELRQAMNSKRSLQARLADVPATYAVGDASSGIPQPPSETQRRLESARQRLDEFLTRFTEQHPDVQNSRRIVADLESALKQERSAEKREAGKRGTGVNVVPNKLYQDLSVALADADSKVAALQARVAEAESRMAQTRELARTVPKVEAEFIQLNRDYESNKTNYAQLLQRRSSAQLSGSMEASSGANEFRVVDPPRVSAQTIWPNRPLLLALSFAASLVAGLALAFFMDSSSPAYYDRESLATMADRPVLGAVSFVHSSKSRSARRRSALGYSFAATAYAFVFFSVIAYYWLGSRGLFDKPQADTTARTSLESSII